MTEENDTSTLRKIRNIYGRVIVAAGTLMGFTMCTYFFTLGIMIDGGHTFTLWFGAVIMVVFVLGFIYLKPLALFITSILLSKNADSRRMLKNMTVADIEKASQ